METLCNIDKAGRQYRLEMIEKDFGNRSIGEWSQMVVGNFD